MYMISNTEHFSGKNEASVGKQKHNVKKTYQRRAWWEGVILFQHNNRR